MKNFDIKYDDEMKHFARGLDKFSRSYGGYIVNGFQFRKLDKDNIKTTQNHGVVVKLLYTPCYFILIWLSYYRIIQMH